MAVQPLHRACPGRSGQHLSLIHICCVTRRERQLLEWIRENPCISQQELADKAGITRSSAEVHISNLMRKGYIADRGYLLREAPYICLLYTSGTTAVLAAVSVSVSSPTVTLEVVVWPL